MSDAIEGFGSSEMKAKILLDYEGDLPSPPGMRVIETEADFLRFVLTDEDKLIRGRRLCQWAQGFYNLREIQFKIVESPVSALQAVFPGLTKEQALDLARRLGKDTLSPAEVTVTSVLNACYPDDVTLWQGSPSKEHAARFLVWQLEHSPSEAEQVVLKQFIDAKRLEAASEKFALLYQTCSSQDARKLLWRWLGAEEEPLSELGEFPIELPDKLLNELEEAWKDQVVKSEGLFFSNLADVPLPVGIRRKIASLVANYYQKNSEKLSQVRLFELQPYLDASKYDELQKHLPPSEPSPLPEEESAVLKWFEEEYLPYRRWQVKYGKEPDRSIAIHHAQTFARWLLDRYYHWLLDGENLIFQKSGRLSKNSKNALTLCIILDGLPAWDAEEFLSKIGAGITRLTLMQKSYCFTALPTVTEFAKNALLRGVAPSLVPDATELSDILPDNRSPVSALKDAQPGRLFFWRVEQPDKAYHSERGERLEGKVRAQLGSILDELANVVQVVPDEIPLRIVITSDHGRLMAPHSPRKIQAPAGTEIHGRAAWGSFAWEFPECGYDVREEAGIVYLYYQTYGLPINNNLCLVWGDESFRNNKGGSESYPHGGLFPEEVIVPWYVFERDAEVKPPSVSITGSGEAKASGTLEIIVQNCFEYDIELWQIAFSDGQTLNERKLCPALRKTKIDLQVSPWPTRERADQLLIKCSFQLPNGKVIFTEGIKPDLKVKTLYQRDEDIFKDLGL